MIEVDHEALELIKYSRVFDWLEAATRTIPIAVRQVVALVELAHRPAIGEVRVVMIDSGGLVHLILILGVEIFVLLIHYILFIVLVRLFLVVFIGLLLLRVSLDRCALFVLRLIFFEHIGLLSLLLCMKYGLSLVQRIALELARRVDDAAIGGRLRMCQLLRSARQVVLTVLVC